jgi:hypothetical protein
VITLHTFENAYDDGNQYHQFLQHGRQHLLDSLAVGQPPGDDLRQFLVNSIIGDCLVEPDVSDRNRDRFERLLNAVLESGDVDKLLDYAGRVCVHGRPVTDPLRTRFGEWTYDACVIVRPTLRELQEDVWASDPQFPRSDWKHEVENDETHLGYWEWVESQREGQTGQPIQLVNKNGYLYVAWGDVHGQEHQKHLDGDDSCLMFQYPAGDVDMVRWSDLNIKLLRGALYDARETGLIADTLSVRLPDGAEFFIDSPYWNVGDRVTWTDPDDGVCSRTGVLTAVAELGDFKFAIAMEDGWMVEVCESELKHAKDGN